MPQDSTHPTDDPTQYRGVRRPLVAATPWPRVGCVAALLCALAVPRLSSQTTQSADLKVSASVVANCTISVPPLEFGAFDPIANVAIAKSVDITLTCTQGSTARVTLDSGGNHDGTTRRMAGAPSRYLKYELYKDSGHLTPWISETTVTVFSPGTNKATITVFGQIPPNQPDVVTGAYTDIVKAVVNF
jgi:spore coat protein U-like protein